MNLLLALSGGADSVALFLHLLEQGTPFEAAHCNFHLRGDESNRDERFVRQLCQAHGVTLHVEAFHTEAEAAATGESIELCARRLRYHWFAALLKARQLDAVAVAHHLDDNAETFLLHLTRGAGLRGLSAMQPLTEQGEGGCRIVRPLLAWTRRDIEAFLKAHQQPYVTDSTNADDLYRRNFLRLRVLPLLKEINPSIAQTLSATARRLEEAQRLVDEAVKRFVENTEGVVLSAEACTIPRAALAATAAPSTLLYELLRPYHFAADDVDRLLAMRTGGILEKNGFTATVSSEAIEVQRTPRPLSAPLPLAIPSNVVLPDGRKLHTSYIECTAGESTLTYISRSACVAVVDADRLNGTLTLRTPEEGARFTPFGMRGSQTVTKYLTNRHASRLEKMQALVVEDAEGIVWLVGERTAQRVAVTKTTKRMVRIELRKE